MTAGHGAAASRVPFPVVTPADVAPQSVPAAAGPRIRKRRRMAASVVGFMNTNIIRPHGHSLWGRLSNLRADCESAQRRYARKMRR